MFYCHPSTLSLNSSQPAVGLRSREQDAAEDASEAAEVCPSHRAGQLPSLACFNTTQDKTIHLRTDPPLSERKPLHHRWIQGSSALQALPQEVSKAQNIPVIIKREIAFHLFGTDIHLQLWRKEYGILV